MSDKLDYAKCVRLIANGGRKVKEHNGVKSLVIAPNTTLERHPQACGVIFYTVRFHQTNILWFGPSGNVTYNVGFDGRYKTVTTKERLNRFGPCHVYQHKKVWYVDGNVIDHTFTYKPPTQDPTTVMLAAAAWDDRTAGCALSDYLEEQLGMPV